MISAAEDPSPVLWTSERRTSVGQNEGMLESDLIVRGSPRASSCILVLNWANRSRNLNAHSCTLRIKIIIPNDGDIKCPGKGLANRLDTLDLDSEGNSMLKCEVYKFIFAGTDKRM